MNYLTNLITSLSFVALLGVFLATTANNDLYSQEKAVTKTEEPLLPPLSGGWTVHRTVDNEAQVLFDKVIGKQTGVRYVPFAYAGQVVAGMNYCFICVAIPTMERAVPSFCAVSFYYDLQGKAHNISFRKIDFRDEK